MARFLFLLGAAAMIFATTWYWFGRQASSPERGLGDDGFYRLIYAAFTSGGPLVGIPHPGSAGTGAVSAPHPGSDLKDSLFGDSDFPVGGNPQGEITIVEFFGYRCSYCKAMAPKLARLIERDVRIHPIYKA